MFWYSCFFCDSSQLKCQFVIEGREFFLNQNLWMSTWPDDFQSHTFLFVALTDSLEWSLSYNWPLKSHSYVLSLTVFYSIIIFLLYRLFVGLSTFLLHILVGINSIGYFRMSCFLSTVLHCLSIFLRATFFCQYLLIHLLDFRFYTWLHFYFALIIPIYPCVFYLP